MAAAGFGAGRDGAGAGTERGTLAGGGDERGTDGKLGPLGIVTGGATDFGAGGNAVDFGTITGGETDFGVVGKTGPLFGTVFGGDTDFGVVGELDPELSKFGAGDLGVPADGGAGVLGVNDGLFGNMGFVLPAVGLGTVPPGVGFSLPTAVGFGDDGGEIGPFVGGDFEIGAPVPASVALVVAPDFVGVGRFGTSRVSDRGPAG